MFLGYFTWDASPEIFNIGPIAIRWYGLLFALSFVVGYELMSRFFKRESRPIKDLEALTFYMIAGTVIGARLGHCFFYEPMEYLANPLEIFKVWKGGLASHGAAIGILISIWLFVKKKKDFDFLWVMDRIVITVALAGFFIRTGNFFNSEILGAPSNAPWAVVFLKFDMLPRHPAQLYEAFAYLFFFFTLLHIYYKWDVERLKGLLFGVFLFLIFTARFVIEFFKEAQVSFEKSMALDMGQILSIPFALAGIYLVINAYKRGKKLSA